MMQMENKLLKMLTPLWYDKVSDLNNVMHASAAVQHQMIHPLHKNCQPDTWCVLDFGGCM